MNYSKIKNNCKAIIGVLIYHIIKTIFCMEYYGNIGILDCCKDEMVKMIKEG